MAANISFFFRRLYRSIFKFLNSFKVFKVVTNKKTSHLTVCEQFCDVLRTAYGPEMPNRLVLLHMKELLKSQELEDMIPDLNVNDNVVIKTLLNSMQFQEKCIPGGPNYVPIICGSLLSEARGLLEIGYTYKEIINSYKLALTKSFEVCKQCVNELDNSDKKNEGTDCSISDRDFFNEEFVGHDPCLPIPKDFHESRVEKAGKSPVSILVYASSFCKDAFECDWSDEYLNAVYEFDKDFDEQLYKLEKEVQIIDDLNVNVIVCYGKFDDAALMKMKEYGLIGVSISDKMDLYRICRSINANAMKSVAECYPFYNVFGIAKSVTVENELAFFTLQMEKKGCNILVSKECTNEYDRDNKEDKYQKDGGSIEIEIAKSLLSYAKECPGIYREGVEKFASALEIIPKTFGEFLGLNTQPCIKVMMKGKNILVFFPQNLSFLRSQKKFLFWF